MSAKREMIGFEKNPSEEIEEEKVLGFEFDPTSKKKLQECSETVYFFTPNTSSPPNQAESSNSNGTKPENEEYGDKKQNKPTPSLSNKPQEWLGYENKEIEQESTSSKNVRSKCITSAKITPPTPWSTPHDPNRYQHEKMPVSNGSNCHNNLPALQNFQPTYRVSPSTEPYVQTANQNNKMDFHFYQTADPNAMIAYQTPMTDFNSQQAGQNKQSPFPVVYGSTAIPVQQQIMQMQYDYEGTYINHNTPVNIVFYDPANSRQGNQHQGYLCQHSYSNQQQYYNQQHYYSQQQPSASQGYTSQNFVTSSAIVAEQNSKTSQGNEQQGYPGEHIYSSQQHYYNQQYYEQQQPSTSQSYAAQMSGTSSEIVANQSYSHSGASYSNSYSPPFIHQQYQAVQNAYCKQQYAGSFQQQEGCSPQMLNNGFPYAYYYEQHGRSNQQTGGSHQMQHKGISNQYNRQQIAGQNTYYQGNVPTTSLNKTSRGWNQAHGLNKPQQYQQSTNGNYDRHHEYSSLYPRQYNNFRSTHSRTSYSPKPTKRDNSFSQNNAEKTASCCDHSCLANVVAHLNQLLNTAVGEQKFQLQQATEVLHMLTQTSLQNTDDMRNKPQAAIPEKLDLIVLPGVPSFSPDREKTETMKVIEQDLLASLSHVLARDESDEKGTCSLTKKISQLDNALEQVQSESQLSQQQTGKSETIKTIPNSDNVNETPLLTSTPVETLHSELKKEQSSGEDCCSNKTVTSQGKQHDSKATTTKQPVQCFETPNVSAMEIPTLNENITSYDDSDKRAASQPNMNQGGNVLFSNEDVQCFEVPENDPVKPQTSNTIETHNDCDATNVFPAKAETITVLAQSGEHSIYVNNLNTLGDSKKTDVEGVITSSDISCLDIEPPSTTSELTESDPQDKAKVISDKTSAPCVVDDESSTTSAERCITQRSRGRENRRKNKMEQDQANIKQKDREVDSKVVENSIEEDQPPALSKTQKKNLKKKLRAERKEVIEMDRKTRDTEPPCVSETPLVKALPTPVEKLTEHETKQIEIALEENTEETVCVVKLSKSQKKRLLKKTFFDPYATFFSDFAEINFKFNKAETEVWKKEEKAKMKEEIREYRARAVNIFLQHHPVAQGIEKELIGMAVKQITYCRSIVHARMSQLAMHIPNTNYEYLDRGESEFASQLLHLWKQHPCLNWKLSPPKVLYDSAFERMTAYASFDSGKETQLFKFFKAMHHGRNRMLNQDYVILTELNPHVERRTLDERFYNMFNYLVTHEALNSFEVYFPSAEYIRGNVKNKLDVKYIEHFRGYIVSQFDARWRSVDLEKPTQSERQTLDWYKNMPLDTDECTFNNTEDFFRKVISHLPSMGTYSKHSPFFFFLLEVPSSIIQVDVHNFIQRASHRPDDPKHIRALLNVWFGYYK